MPETLPEISAELPRVVNYSTLHATYTTAQIAELLQCSERHIARLVQLGIIPGKIRCGRLVRFSRELVDAWLRGPGHKEAGQ